MTGGIFQKKREKLVEHLKATLAIRTKTIENAFLATKRELFVPKNMREHAYADDALPIGLGQTISQPTTIAAMLEMLGAKKEMRVADVGSGSGYLAALLSHIVGEKGQVIACEIMKELAEKSRESLKAQGCTNVTVIEGDAAEALPPHGPFDRIIISAACPFIPRPLFGSLKEGGAAVAPVGDQSTQALTRLSKIKGKPVKKEFLESRFVFVPLRGKHGFRQL
ncbi:MAG: protein-L-isoaspartate(D-aspartate) O-methyltransferase [Candidatus Diapherotrites archaeon]|nr:protein-L-isoaspartate(D-aspartate) O-methyltransferase [Candidatus Diapherotrites archaeon]